MAITEIYVNPALASNTGAGTVGDPYGDLEWAIGQETWDGVNGMRFNIKAGTDEVVAAEIGAALTTNTYTPSLTAQLYFQGYTSAAEDGGIGGISGGGLVSVIADTTHSFVHFIDLHCHNTGANTVVGLYRSCSVLRCEVDDSTGIGISVNLWSIASQNYVHNIGNIGVLLSGRGVVKDNLFVSETNSFSNTVQLGGESTVIRNIFSIDGSGTGIYCTDDCTVEHNSIYSDAGTGFGIYSTANESHPTISNNLIEGFSGAGGTGIDLDQGGVYVGQYQGNAVFNCETEYNDPAFYGITADNESLTVSPFTDAANGDFSPVDTGSVKEGALPASFPTP